MMATEKENRELGQNEIEERFAYSIIMAVYNVAPFIRDAVDSLINQDFGFSRVQVILVDDGSTDESGQICDEYQAAYPENILSIHKENGGQASARNEGLKYAEGHFINFMDPDDKLSQNALTAVYKFFLTNEDKTDMVAIPMYFFEGQHGEHWQNTKFRKGNRIIYLAGEYKTQQTSASSTFYGRRVLGLLEFDTVLPNNEDFKVNLRVLAERWTLGVVCNCKYWYRRRKQGQISTVQGITANRRWYFEWFTNLSDWACEYYRNRFGYIPAFVQYGVLCDILWRYKADNWKEMKTVLSAEEREKHIHLLQKTLKNYDDKYIMETPELRAGHKYLMLKHKYGTEPEISGLDNDALVHYGNTELVRMGILNTQLEFLSIAHGRVRIEGYTNIVGIPEDENIEVFLRGGNQDIACRIICRTQVSQQRFGEVIVRAIGFVGEVPLDDGVEIQKINVICVFRGLQVMKTELQCGKYAPISHKVRNSYFCSEGWRLSVQEAQIVIERCDRKKARRSEFQLLKELWKKNQRGMRKAVIVRPVCVLLKKLKRKPIWIISDRINRAGDNGEALFRYICKNNVKDIKAYFVIMKDSPNYVELNKVGPVLEYYSLKHKLLLLISDRIISSSGDDAVKNPFGIVGEYYKDMLSQIPYVFLQHGVTKDDQSNWLNRYNRGIDGFITSGKVEYQSILHGDQYYYNDSQVWLTGMPRYDRLYNNVDRKVTIMPTWREYLMGSFNPVTGVRELGVGFEDSAYFQFYSQLLKHPKLLDAAKRYNYVLQFYPHPNIIPYVDHFEADLSIRILHEDTEYRTIYAESELLVTDYSSAVFDFAYLHRPIIYAQFDAEEFFAGEHVYKRGYFDYERDGFGEVEYDLESTVDRIIEYMRNGCKMKPKYEERVDQFFAFHDQKNCQRVFEKICAMEEK